MHRPSSLRIRAAALVGLLAGIAAVSAGPALAGPRSQTGAVTPSVSGAVAPQAGSTQPSSPFCTPATLSQAQQQVASDLSGRVTQLNTLLSEVDASTQLTAPNRQTLQNDISSVELPGIEGLQPQVAQATTCAEVRQDAHEMVFTYRVYRVMTPQTHLAIAADTETSVEGLFTSLEPSIAAAIQSGAARGKDVSAAQSADTDLQNQVTNAQNASNGLSAQVVAQSPPGTPASWQVFLGARAGVTTAHTDLQAAYAELTQIQHDLS